jgi:hypothetical protein
MRARGLATTRAHAYQKVVADLGPFLLFFLFFLWLGLVLWANRENPEAESSGRVICANHPEWRVLPY